MQHFQTRLQLQVLLSFEQQPNESPPAVNSHRTASLRQLSSNFSQFNNLFCPLRSRKSLTRKEAAAINEWRSSRLKEFRDRNIEVENEGFDRYMHNISLLEEKSENVRKRIQQIVDGGLKKLQKLELNEPDKRAERAKGSRAERASALSDLVGKLNKAHNEEDLNSCMKIKAQLSSQHTRSRTETKDVDEVLKEQIDKNGL
ncbi:hypothetical protein OIU77_023408, partial [Salix suchowensis]